jgi:hypothetical protein
MQVHQMVPQTAELVTAQKILIGWKVCIRVCELQCRAAAEAPTEFLEMVRIMCEVILFGRRANAMGCVCDGTMV